MQPVMQFEATDRRQYAENTVETRLSRLEEEVEKIKFLSQNRRIQPKNEESAKLYKNIASAEVG